MTHYATYRSPITLLKELGVNVSELTPELLRSEQLRLSDFLQSTSQEHFLIGTHTITRNEFTAFIASLDSVERIRVHQLIDEQASITRLLTEQVISGKKSEDYRLGTLSTSEEATVSAIISPFLAVSIDRLMDETIRQSSYTELIKIAPLFHFLTPQHGKLAFNKLNSWVHALDGKLNDPLTHQSVYPSEKYAYFEFSPFHELIKEASIFYPEIADALAETLSTFLLSYRQSKKREDHLLKISTLLLTLNCSPHVHEKLEKNHELFLPDSKDSVKKGAGLWITLASCFVVILVLVIYTLTKNSDPSVDHLASTHRSGDSDDEEYVSTTPSSSRVLESGFDLEAFSAFHEHTILTVAQRDFNQNEFRWDGVPNIKSPLVMTDSAMMQPGGKKIFLLNETDSEMLMVVRDQNSLSAYYVKAQSKKSIHLDPGSLIFFYAGTNWNDEKNIEYDHPYRNLMTDTWTIRYTGHFVNSDKIAQEFLGKIHVLKNGSTSDLRVVEENGNYYFKKGKFNIPTI